MLIDGQPIEQNWSGLATSSTDVGSHPHAVGSAVLASWGWPGLALGGAQHSAVPEKLLEEPPCRAEPNARLRHRH